MDELPQSEVLDVFTRFLDEIGAYNKFIDFIKSEGYSPSEFGMND